MPHIDDYGRRFENKPASTSFGVGLMVTIGILVIVAIAAILVFGFNVGTADVKGRGDAYRQQRSGNNRIFAQQHFEDLKAAIDKDLANIKVAKQAYKTDPNTITATNVTGVQQICNADVADYNASARKYLERDFKASDLPNNIDLALCAGEE